MSFEKMCQMTNGRIIEAYYDYAHLTNLIYEALDFGMESVQIFPNQLDMAVEVLKGKEVKPSLRAVITYPHGTFLTSQKVFEIKDAIGHGADQLDVVLNVVNARSGEWDKVREEMKECRKAAEGKILEFIIEDEYLKDDMLEEICRIACEEKIDRLATSIGVYPMTGKDGEYVAGAEAVDIRKMKIFCGDKVKICAMGNITTVERFKEMVDSGADFIACENAGTILRNMKGGC